MFRGRIVCLFVVAALLVGATTASAQDEKKWGLGVDLQNQGFLMTAWITTLENAVGQFGDPVSAVSPFMGTQLTPCFLITVRPTPNWFIEPLIGFHSVSGKNEYTDPADAAQNTTEDFSASELKLGLSAIYDIRPQSWCAPYVRGIFGWHKLTATNKETTVAGTDEEEAKATAFEFAGAVGGIISIKDCLFITLEARAIWATMGDTEFTATGPGNVGATDRNETDGSAFWTDMAVGLRFLFF